MYVLSIGDILNPAINPKYGAMQNIAVFLSRIMSDWG